MASETEVPVFLSKPPNDQMCSGQNFSSRTEFYPVKVEQDVHHSSVAKHCLPGCRKLDTQKTKDSQILKRHNKLLNGEQSEAASTKSVHPSERPPGENHVMSSDSESPNRWSSSPSDSSPKLNQTLTRYTKIATSSVLKSSHVVHPSNLAIDLFGKVDQSKSYLELDQYAQTFQVTQ